jgi:hypothetical protein
MYRENEYPISEWEDKFEKVSSILRELRIQTHIALTSCFCAHGWIVAALGLSRQGERTGQMASLNCTFGQFKLAIWPVLTGLLDNGGGRKERIYHDFTNKNTNITNEEF